MADNPFVGAPTLNTTIPTAVVPTNGGTVGASMAAKIAAKLQLKKNQTQGGIQQVAAAFPLVDNQAPDISPHQSGLQMPPDLR